MHKGRLEAFSDAVIAIVLTIMVLELRPPHGQELAALLPLGPVFAGYVLSFVILAIYWNNHHHMLQSSRVVNGATLWANMHLLFWLSMMPFVTGWIGESGFAPWPVAVYGFVMFMAGVAYYILAQVLRLAHGDDSPVAQALGKDLKGKASVALYAASVPLALVAPFVSVGIFVFVALMWFVPDRRFERLDRPA